MQRASALRPSEPGDARSAARAGDEAARSGERAPRGGARAGPRLCRLPMVRAGRTRIPRDEVLLGASPTGLSEAGRSEVKRLTQHWEWADAVVSSPLRRARETAALLAGNLPIALAPDLRPRELGPWEGRPPSALRAIRPDSWARWQSGDADFDLLDSEAPERFRARVAAALEALLASPHRSVLLVAHLCVIRTIAALLAGPLPPERPWPAEMVLLTRQQGGRFAFGRRTSDPEPLRSPLERCGLAGRPFERPPERHVASLELRAPGRGGPRG